MAILLKIEAESRSLDREKISSRARQFNPGAPEFCRDARGLSRRAREFCRDARGLSRRAREFCRDARGLSRRAREFCRDARGLNWRTTLVSAFVNEGRI